ncbi:gliding motility-associated-like protein [Lewinella aquimaris]|uniref:Gliding motility-associated-like protein n=1 Tax=Neolewinella aquimaris TaxID=1835722 RepID=A0A840DX43_9BACT|nr:PKD domain-containing protein [Neolewinella aquimaris]MBB4077571.1 gliding motility-associated-like protein [Neolewinella aquimaris]
MNLIFLRSLAILVIVVCQQAVGQSQTFCGGENSFLLPPARTFCVNNNDSARISFNLINEGDPGDYTISFPNGTDTTYVGVDGSLQIIHDMEFICSNPPGDPIRPSRGEEFYAYRGELIITRTDCVDDDLKPQVGTYPFNIIPNPISDITINGRVCGEPPYNLSFDAKLCNDDLVKEYQWYLNGRLLPNATGKTLRDVILPTAGEYIVRLETTTFSDKCESFAFERPVIVVGEPTIELNYTVDSSALCSPVVTVTTDTRYDDVTSFMWSSSSPDVSFSDVAAPSPVITVLNSQSGTRTITLTVENEYCNSVSESFDITTYSEQRLRTTQALRACSGVPITFCDRLVYEPAPVTILWTTDDPARIEGANTACPEVTFTQGGTYELTATGTNICGDRFTETFPVTVRDDAPLQLDFSSVDTLCPGSEPLNLFHYIQGSENVSKITGPGVIGNFFNPAHLSGTVSLAVSDSCGSLYPFEIFVLSEGVYAGGDPHVCMGDSIDLYALQEGTYSGPGVSDNVFSSVGLEAGTYTIDFVSTNLCGGEGSFDITVEPIPVASFDMISDGCLGGDAGAKFPVNEPISLVNRSDAEVLCYSVLETGDKLCGSNEAVFTLPVAGMYTFQQVVAFAGGLCTDTLRQKIEVIPVFKPHYAIQIDSTDCDSILISFLNGGGTDLNTYSWTFSSGDTLQLENPTLRLLRPYSAEVLTATVTATDGCITVRDTFPINLPRRFQVSFGILNDNNTICSGDTAFLVNNSVGAFNLLATLNGGRQIDSLPTSLIIENHSEEVLKYPIRLDGTNPSCPAEYAVDTLLIAPVNTQAAFTLHYDDSCSPAQVELINHSTPGSVNRIIWGDGSTFQGIRAFDTASYTYAVERDTNFTISLSSQLCGSDTFSTNFMVRASPDASFNIAAPDGDCVDEEIIFNPVAAARGNSMAWRFGDGKTSMHHRPHHTYDTTGTYRVRLEVTNSNGCRAVDSTELVIGNYTGPALAVSIPPAVCEDAPLNLDLPNGVDNLFFDYGNDSRSGKPIDRPYQEEGEYELTVTKTDKNGCSIDTTRTIKVHPRFSVEIIPDEDLTVEFGTPLELSFRAMPARRLDSIRWYGDSVVSPYTRATTVFPSGDGVYEVMVTDEYGCLATDSIRVAVSKEYERRVYVPNIFSPNGDGRNETFGIDVKPNTVRAIRYLRIINRWGTMVYECQNCPAGNSGNGWDGTVGGKPMQSAIYLWAAEIEFADGVSKVFSGDVTLIR